MRETRKSASAGAGAGASAGASAGLEHDCGLCRMSTWGAERS